MVVKLRFEIKVEVTHTLELERHRAPQQASNKCLTNTTNNDSLPILLINTTYLLASPLNAFIDSCFHHQSAADFYVLQIKGNFHDFYFFFPVAYSGLCE
jgi:hypothetical protein